MHFKKSKNILSLLFVLLLVSNVIISVANANEEQEGDIDGCFDSHGNYYGFGDAIKQGDRKKIENVLRKECQSPQAGLETALFLCSEEYIDFFIGRGADINNGFTVRRVMQERSLEVFEIARSKGMRLESELQDLSSLVGEDKLDEFQYLIKESLNQDEIKGFIRDPLLIHEAAKSGSKAVIDFLVSLGADPKHVKALEGAVLGNRDEIVDYFFNEMEASPQNTLALAAAIRVDNQERIKFFIDAGVSLGSVEVLAAAAHRGDLELMEKSIDQGADVKAPVVLEEAIAGAETLFNFNEGVAIRFLLERGVDVNQESALMKVVRIYSSDRAIEIMDIFLEYGADITSSKILGAAIKADGVAMVEYLIEHKADVKDPALFKSILEVYDNEKQKKIVDLLIENGVKFEDESFLLLAANQYRWDLVKHLITKHGIDASSPRLFEKAAGIWSPSPNDALSMVKLLIENGANPRNEDALVKAAGHKKFDVLKYLIAEYGLKVTNPEILKNVVCSMGYKGDREDNLEIIELLIEHGANIQNEKALACAAGFGLIPVLELLMEHGASLGDSEILIMTMFFSEKTFDSDVSENVKFLLKHGANAKNFLSIKASVEAGDLSIVKLLIDYGAEVNDSIFVDFAALRGNVEVVQYLKDLDGVEVKDRKGLELALQEGRDALIKFALYSLGDKENAVIIGMSNIEGEFSDYFSAMEVDLEKNIAQVCIVPIDENIVCDKEMMKLFSGFMNPGSGDTYPGDKENFSLEDMDEKKMEPMEHLYQNIISFAKENGVPYIGFCAGAQHLVLNSKGFLQSVDGYSNEHMAIDFERGSMPHYMTLDRDEKAQAINECELNAVHLDNGQVMHGYAAVRDKLGENVRLGAVSYEGIPQAASWGWNLAGFQFHPENHYRDEKEDECAEEGVHRQVQILNSFFEMCINYKKSRSYADRHGMDFYTMKKAMEGVGAALVNRLEDCAEGNAGVASSKYVWGYGDHRIKAEAYSSDDVIKLLLGITPDDVSISREGENLKLYLKDTGEALTIESHFEVGGAYRVEWIDFADGTSLDMRYPSLELRSDEMNL